MDFIWILYGFYMVFIWFLYGFYMGFIWVLYGFYWIFQLKQLFFDFESGFVSWIFQTVVSLISNSGFVSWILHMKNSVFIFF